MEALEKLKRFNASRAAVYTVLGGIGAFMLLLNLLTPYCADDFTYMVNFKTQQWIKNVWDVFPSMIAHAGSMNGRLISHGLGQLFLIWPKPVFDVVNAGVFTWFIYLMYKLANGKKEGNALLLACLFCGVWLFMPVFGQVALWQLGSVNYLWALLAGALFLRPYISDYMDGRRETALWRKIVFCVLAVPVGMWAEVTSFIAILLAALMLLLGRLFKKQSLRTWLLCPIGAACAGYLLMMLMPAEMNAKSAGLSLSTLLLNFENATLILRKDGLLLLCVWAAAFVMGLAARLDRDRLAVSGALAFGAVAGNYMLTFASYYPERCFCTTAALLAAAIAILAPELCRAGWAWLCGGLGAALAVAAALSLIVGTYDIWCTHVAFDLREQYIAQAKAEGLKEVTVPVIRPTTKYSAFWGITDLTGDAMAWPNDYISTYYGIWISGQ